MAMDPRPLSLSSSILSPSCAKSHPWPATLRSSLRVPSAQCPTGKSKGDTP